MNKELAKKILHWIGFIAALASAFYVAILADGLSVGQRVGLAGTTLGALFVSLGQILPRLDAAVDKLPGLLVVPAVCALAGAGALTACNGVKPDKFLDAVVDCAKVNPETDAALASVETCLIGAISQNPAACLSGLITEAHFAVDEVACIVAWEAQQANAKVAAGDATAISKRDTAAQWLAAERISIRNSYR